MSARIEYAPGEAWCVATGRIVLVCERDLTPAVARRLHADAASVATLEGLRALVEAEPTALIGLVDLDGARALLRRHGVPAEAAGEALPDRYGAAWSFDETGAGSSVAAGGLDALEGATLPLEGGVARVAAVRVTPRTDASSEGGEPLAAAETRTPEPAIGAFGQTLPTGAATGAATGSATGAATGAVAPAAAPQLTDTGNPISGLIDSVPGFIKPAVDLHGMDAADGGAAITAPASALTGAPAPAVPAGTGADHPAPDASDPRARPDASAPATAPGSSPSPGASATPAASPAGADLGDHDGMTVTADQARRLRAEDSGRDAPGAADAAPAAAPATGPLVLSTLCPIGHVNAPGTTACSTCGAPIDESSAAQRRRPEIAVAVLTSGERVPLGRGVVIGRRPRSRRVEDGRVPRLVTVESPSEDISRSHLELRVEDWNLVAIDLSSTNGTLLLREGAAPQRLRPEASTILQLGDRLDLGDAQVVTIESAP